MAAVLPTIFGAGATTAGAAATVLGAGATVFGALSQADSLKMQAKQAEMQGYSEETQAMEKGNVMREEFLKNLSSSQALFGGQGTSLSTGDPLNAALESTKNSMKNTAKVELQGKINKGQSAIQAMQYRKEARSTVITGTMSAAKTLLGH
ncbi:MAG: hypothetical protein HGA87_01710 [Desulfobulbaceae bacterium]|nr:hypothetical protein [Desulfobulbaceae bacterium]